MTTNRTSDPRFLHHGQAGFCNSDPSVVMGDFPWYEMVRRSLRGDFKPLSPPANGYAAFAKAWSVPVDRARIAQRPQEPTVAHPIRIHFTPAQHWSRHAIWPPRAAGGLAADRVWLMRHGEIRAMPT